MATILVIDDESRIRRWLRELLESAGYRAVTAASGDEGLRCLRERPADLVVTDIIMPDKEGIETMMDIQQEFPGLPIIAISGGSLQGLGSYLPTAAALGAFATLQKPFRGDRLLQLIQAALSQN
jgi:DNA-binding NtrC family response regulator